MQEKINETHIGVQKIKLGCKKQVKGPNGPKGRIFVALFEVPD